jgi:hypothetical protein
MATALGAALALTLVTLIHSGTGEPGTVDALRVTARWSYVLFWPAYAGGAMAALFGPAFNALAQRGREFGLAFASAHLVHAGLVAWLYHIAVQPPGRNTLVFFGAALFWTYLLALLSIKQLAGMLKPTALRLLRTVGVEYIALAFLADFARNPFGSSALHVVAYLPFLTLAIAGPVLRLAVWLRRLIRSRTLAF